MDITIDNKTYTIKYGFRALMIYERLTDESFTAANLNQIITFMYACLAASDIEFTMTFDDFLSWLDDNPTVLSDFSQWLISQFKRDENLSNDKSDKSDNKKSVSKKKIKK